MTTITLISLLNSVEKGDLNKLKELKMSEKNIKKLEDIGACRELRKIDLSTNLLESLEVFLKKSSKILKKNI